MTPTLDMRVRNLCSGEIGTVIDFRFSILRSRVFLRMDDGIEVDLAFKDFTVLFEEVPSNVISFAARKRRGVRAMAYVSGEDSPSCA